MGLLLFPFSVLHLNVPELGLVVPTRIKGLKTQPGTKAKKRSSETEGRIPVSFPAHFSLPVQMME